MAQSTIDYSQLNSASTFAVPGVADAPAFSNYQIASDNHNYGSGDFAITDPSTWGTGLSNTGKFIVASTISGAAGLYNSGITVANWFGAGAEELKAGTYMAELDSDLGRYYTDNKESVDLVGFIASSLVPGTLGVKVLNAGQKSLRLATETGMIGGNLGKVTGLLTPATERYTVLAAQEIAQTRATFSAMSGYRLKAIASGFGQAALESAAFETAVAVTTFKSPVLEDADIGDILQNIAIGGALGTVIGGSLTAARTYGAIKKEVKAADLLEKPYTHITDIPGLTPAQRLVERFNDIEQIPAIAAGGEFTNKFTRLKTAKEDKLNNLIREDVHELTAGKDIELGNQIADTLRGLPASQITNNFLHATEIGRLSNTLEAEKELAKSGKKLIKSGAAQVIEETGAASGTKSIGYVKLLGEEAGAVSFTHPVIPTLGDTFKNSEEVIKAVKGYGFDVKKLWSAIDSQSVLESEARYIWADKFAKIKSGMQIHENDIPLLEKALEYFNKQNKGLSLLEEKIADIRVVSKQGFEYSITNADDLYKHLLVSKQEAAWYLLQGKKAGTGMSTEEIAIRTNVRKSYLDGEVSSDSTRDLLARQSFQREYTDQLVAAGVRDVSKGLADISTLPKYFKVAYDTRPLQDIDGFVLEGMAHLKERYKVYQAGIDNVLAKHTGEFFDQLYHPSEALILKANRYGAGPGLFSFANGNYHSLESWTEQIGSVVGRFRLHLKDETRNALEPAAYKLASKPEAAIEFSAINQKISATSEHYILDKDRGVLVAQKLQAYRDEIAAGNKKAVPPKLQEGAPEEIPITHSETLEAATAHIAKSDGRTSAFQELRAAQGFTDEKTLGVFRPIRPNLKDYPHFAFVVDPTVSGVGHVSMVHAASEKELQSLVDRVPNNYKTITKAQSKDFHQAQQDFEYSRTLHENYIDADLHRSGVNSSFFPKTDARKIATEFVDQHIRSDDVFARELINAKFEKEFTELRRLGEQYTDIATSKYTGSYRSIEETTKNPYYNYVKTALDISQISEHPFLYGLNNILDSAFSRGMQVVTNAFGATKSPADLELVNRELQRNGVKTAYYDAATDLYANHSAPKGDLVKFIRGANSLLATTILRLDPLNAINNTVGANVLLGSETKTIIRAIREGNTEAAGELAQLLKLQIPGIGDEILAPGKLITNSFKRFFSEEGKQLSEFYRANGWIKGITDQYKSMLDDLTLVGSENVSVLNKKLSEAFAKAKSLSDLGEKVTGNKLAEDFNRFVAADVMKQISDVGVKYGIIGEAEQLSYINTFVNRTQGNVQASQRPLMFQGAIGQAIGLFQTYQFNLMQQLFRHISEGRGKDAAMMLGLQSTIYGMNGLPAFAAINTHILGTMSGNPSHVDAYSATYGAVGRNTGDLLLYGIASKLLDANLYSRGDINPRQVTILPTNPLDVPFINATLKVLSNVKDTVGKIAGGGNVWETLLQGIEHNGLSRPLAGIAQVGQAAINDGTTFSTSTEGNILAANDLFSWASATRIAGGKPLDEGIVNDATFRINVYQAVDNEKKKQLAETLKSTVIAKQEPSQDQVERFAARYAELGGKQREFNKWMLKQITTANTSQANKIMEHLQSPYAQNMQRVMGGRDILDGNDF